ncbi:MAG TPA: EAL domain-containing protein [Devosia sp.]|nr:EAL domain-containing protein [Devosia sp.]
MAFFIIAVLGMLLLGGGIYFGVNYAVERVVVADAKDKTQAWIDYFLSAMPDLDELLVNGQLTPAQRSVINAAEKVGDIFRFKVYSADARQILVSDDPNLAGAVQDKEPKHSLEAAAVMTAGTSDIQFHETAKAGTPPAYVEAYVPIIDDGGKTHGVIEVYVDQTHTTSLLRTTFTALALGLAIVVALGFGLLSFAVLLRSRQVKAARKEAEFFALHDPLTGLLNRVGFAERVKAAMDAPAWETAALVGFDIDGFKSLNETHGEAAGDQLLRHMARCLAGPIREREASGRLGGDEFMVLLRNREPEDVRTYVETVLAAVREPITVDGRVISGTLSAGIYMIGPRDEMARALYRTDVALYQAKVDGRNTARQFSAEMESRIASRRALEARLRDAVRNEGLAVYFQPLMDARQRACIGFEALVRLLDGEGGTISPAVFIPVAEDLGLINEIGAWVLREATRVAAGWPENLTVAVNLSVSQFGDGRLVETVREALAESGLPPHRLELEVTESMLIEDPGRVGAQLAELRALGASIAMDDFGSGYSSLGYLWQFGFDKLKIDRAFITALDANEGRAREVLDTIIMLGHKLDMRVTAEGIETERHADVLAELGCDQLQGFLYARPAPATELAAFLMQSYGETGVGRVTGRKAIAG